VKPTLTEQADIDAARRERFAALTLDDLERWIEAQSDRHRLGLACSTLGCPLAGFLLDALDEETAVQRRKALIGSQYGPKTKIELPRWMELFVQFTDASGKQRNVTKAGAVRVFARVKEHMS
jgi:hypothetical protein